MTNNTLLENGIIKKHQSSKFKELHLLFLMVLKKQFMCQTF